MTKIQFHIFFVLAVVVCSPITTNADGIPVTEDLKHLRYEHAVIKLNKAQVYSVERYRRVRFTPEQHKKLKRIDTGAPIEMPVLSARWDSCTCGYPVYAVWCRIGEIDVPHSSIANQKWTDEDQKANAPEEQVEDKTAEKDEEIEIRKTIILDSKGDMFLEGRLIDENKLRSIIDGVRNFIIDGKEVYRLIYFDIPPPIDDRIDKKICDLVDRIECYCEKKGINFWALGLSMEKLKRKWELESTNSKNSGRN